MSATAETTLQAGTAVIVFGLDGSGRAHASAFDQADASRAERAAEVMGLRVLRPDSDEQHALARKLPRGRVFASGKAFVPFVRAGLYEALTALAGASATKPPASAQSASTASPKPPEGIRSPKPPCGWADIQVGSVVLATEGPMEGWFESVVIRAEDSDKFVLKWRDWPDEPTFVRRRVFLGLMHPAGGARA